MFRARVLCNACLFLSLVFYMCVRPRLCSPFSVAMFPCLLSSTLQFGEEIGLMTLVGSNYVPFASSALGHAVALHRTRTQTF